MPEAREAPLLSSTLSQVPRGGLGCGTSGWMSLRVSVRVSEQRATQIQVTWRGTEAAEAPGAAERSVVARAFRLSSACLPKPLAFPYHFSASCYLSDILAKLNWALCPRLSWVRLYLD